LKANIQLHLLKEVYSYKKEQEIFAEKLEAKEKGSNTNYTKDFTECKTSNQYLDMVSH
jgi:hypothetical protein